MTRIKRKSFIIKYFARIAERTDLQKKTKNSNASVIRLLAVYFGNNWKSHSTLTLLATQNYPFLLKYDCPLWLK